MIKVGGNSRIMEEDSPIIGLGKIYPFALLITMLWRECFNEAIHFTVSAISALLIALLIYLANNFWMPYYFPKDRQWRAFNFLNPNRSK